MGNIFNVPLKHGILQREVKKEKTPFLSKEADSRPISDLQSLKNDRS
jgi:hypothetical protein